jgi:hypothetical protein
MSAAHNGGLDRALNSFYPFLNLTLWTLNLIGLLETDRGTTFWPTMLPIRFFRSTRKRSRHQIAGQHENELVQ